MPTPATGASPTASKPLADVPRTRRRGTALQELGLVGVILILGIGLTLAAPRSLDSRTGQTVNNFLRSENLLSIGSYMAICAVMAIGTTPVIITGGIDISVGSICGLSALGTVAVLQQFKPEAGAMHVIPVGLAIGCGIGLACGLINGALTVGLRLHPFIVTLGTLSVFRCIATVTVPMQNLPDPDKSVPTAFTSDFLAWAPAGHLEMQPVPLLFALAFMGIVWFFLSWTVAGRETYAVGSNAEAARYSGIRVPLIRLMAFCIGGLAAGLAGAMYAGYYGSASSDTATGYELQVIAAAVVGGASLTGGRGTALGALLGALVIQLIIDGIDVLKFNQQYSQGIVGAAIIVAAVIDQELSRLRARRIGGGAV
jgi:ribose/xylose/arabinose/galactoside ABC-type transport system permease subunit